MANHQYDDLFDAWGQALNVNPQLGKTVFHIESNGDPNVRNGRDGEIGGMQIKPETAAMLARKMGMDPNAVNLHDMRWAVPLAMRYLADGLNATQSAEGAMGYYNSGSADPRRWKPDYINKGRSLYPNMGLTPLPALPPASPPAATAAPDEGNPDIDAGTGLVDPAGTLSPPPPTRGGY
jgi:soluble lytic murein transglycosylase-like protein